MRPIEPVSIILGGVERQIILDCEVICLAERKLNQQRREDGLPSTNMWQETFASNFSMQVVTCFLWAAMRQSHPKIEIEEVRSMVGDPIHVIQKTTDAVTAHLKAVRDDIDDSEVGDADSPLPQVTARPNGLDSGHSRESN